MKKIMLLVVIVASLAFSLDHITTTYTSVPGAVVASAGLNANKDSLKNGINRVIDTVNNKFTRITSFSDHGMAFNWMNIDTIGGKVRMDTITMSGFLKGDSLSTRTIYAKKEIANVSYIDTLFLNTGASNYISGSILPSIYKSNEGGAAAPFLEYGNLIFQARTNVSNATRGIYFAGGYPCALWGGFDKSGRWVINGFTGDSSFTVNGSGSISTNLKVGGTATIDSLKSTKGISATIGRFSSLLFGDSLAITKGISATYGRFSSAVFGTSATFTATATVDSLKSTKGINATTGTFSGRVAAAYFTTNGLDSLAYEDTTFNDTLYDGTTYLAHGTAKVVKVGKLTTLYIPSLYGTVTSETTTYIKGMPSKFAFKNAIFQPVSILNNGTYEMGLLRCVVGQSYIIINTLYKMPLSTGIGFGGLDYQVISWVD